MFPRIDQSFVPASHSLQCRRRRSCESLVHRHCKALGSALLCRAHIRLRPNMPTRHRRPPSYRRWCIVDCDFACRKSHNFEFVSAAVRWAHIRLRRCIRSIDPIRSSRRHRNRYVHESDCHNRRRHGFQTWWYWACSRPQRSTCPMHSKLATCIARRLGAYVLEMKSSCCKLASLPRLTAPAHRLRFCSCRCPSYMRKGTAAQACRSCHMSRCCENFQVRIPLGWNKCRYSPIGPEYNALGEFHSCRRRRCALYLLRIVPACKRRRSKLNPRHRSYPHSHPDNRGLRRSTVDDLLG